MNKSYTEVKHENRLVSRGLDAEFLGEKQQHKTGIHILSPVLPTVGKGTVEIVDFLRRAICKHIF